MQVHANAKLGLAGRRELVRVVEGGASLRVAAARFGVAPATAHRWCSRWRQASEPERSSLACLKDRSSRPHCSPRLLTSAEQERICAARRRTSWGPRLIAGEVGHPHSTVSKVLARHGLSRLPRPARQAANRYEWPCPGDLLHMDTKRYARFARPGHAVTGNRVKTSAERTARWGYEYAPIPSSMTTPAWPPPSCTPTSAPPPSPASSSAPWPGTTDSASSRAGS
jgi:transposase